MSYIVIGHVTLDTRPSLTFCSLHVKLKAESRPGYKAQVKAKGPVKLPPQTNIQLLYVVHSNTWLYVRGSSPLPEEAAVVPWTSLLTPLPPSPMLLTPLPSPLPPPLIPLPEGWLGSAHAPNPPPPPPPIADDDWPLPLLLLRVWPFPEKALTWELDDCFCTAPLRPIVILGCSSDSEWPCCELW